MSTPAVPLPVRAPEFGWPPGIKAVSVKTERMIEGRPVASVRVNHERTAVGWTVGFEGWFGYILGPDRPTPEQAVEASMATRSRTHAVHDLLMEVSESG